MPNAKRPTVMPRRTVMVASLTVQCTVTYIDGQMRTVEMAPHGGRPSLLLTLHDTAVNVTGEPRVSHTEGFSQHRHPRELARLIGRYLTRAFGLDPSTAEPN